MFINPIYLWYIMISNKIICLKCKSENTKKDGVRETENRGLIQRYKCKECSHRFILDDGFNRMRNTPQKITLCLDLFYRGISTRKVQEHLQAFYPHNSSHKTIYKWIVKYSKQISNFTDKIKLNVGKELQIDEMEIGSRKSKHNGWFIDSIDTETRYMVASKFAKSRMSKEIKSVLKSAKNKTGNQIKVVTSDGYNAYIEAVRFMGIDKRFSVNPKVIHKVVTQLKNEGFNIKIERLHNSVRHRIKTFRGFHGSPESANSILKGWEIYYNFIRKHQALNKCPYELATDIKLSNPNKWLELINLSKLK